MEVLRREKDSGFKGGLYHKIQIELTYNSNHIEGSKLTHEQTQFIFETKTVGVLEPSVKIDDILETVNHFHCVDFVIENANAKTYFDIDTSKILWYYYPIKRCKYATNKTDS